jgi:exonuclease III
MRISTQNVRSIRDESRWQELENILYWQEMDIVVLTETARTENLVATPKSLLTMEEQETAMKEINEGTSQDKLDPRSKRNLGKAKKRLMVKKSLNICQTNPVSTRGTGVAIVSKHQWKLMPLFKELWSNCICCCLASKRDATGIARMIVVGYYAKHGEHNEQDERLTFLLKNLHQAYKKSEIVLLGDFNRNRILMLDLAQRLNLKLLEQQAPKPTRVQGSQESEIDFILTRYENQQTRVEEIWDKSDHLQVHCELNIKKGWDKITSCYNTEVLKKGTLDEEIDAIFLDDNWPLQPFVQVAKQHGITQQCKKKVSDAHQLKEINKQL